MGIIYRQTIDKSACFDLLNLVEDSEHDPRFREEYFQALVSGKSSIDVLIYPWIVYVDF